MSVGRLLAVFSLATTVGLAQAATIRWEVEQRFPLIQEHGDWQRIEAHWRALGTGASMWTLLARLMQEKAGSDPGRFLLTRPPPAGEALDLAGRHLRAGPSFTRWVRLSASADAGCDWVVDPPPRRIEPISRGGPGVPCEARVEVPVETSHTVRLNSVPDSATRLYIRQIVIVAMGDSYSSGEGSPDRPALYGSTETPSYNDWFRRRPDGPFEPAHWWDPVCHRSMLSWPVMAALRVALEARDAVVQLVNSTCSGAELFDGIFWAQRQGPAPRGTNPKLLVERRDGVGAAARIGVEDDRARYLARSQVNAVRDALCLDAIPDAGDLQDAFIELPEGRGHAVMRGCRRLRQPDALLLTIGGNDVKFGGAVTDVFLPRRPRQDNPLLGAAGLWMLRGLLGTVSPATLAENARRMAPAYGRYVDAIQLAVGATHFGTVLLEYPNPLVEGDAHACVTGPAPLSHFERLRLRNSFLAFGLAVHEGAPPVAKPFIRGWTVEIDDNEASTFARRAYPALRAMQAGAGDRVQAWLPRSASARSGLADPSFSGRLLCSVGLAGADRKRQLELEPVYFCNDGECARMGQVSDAEQPCERVAVPDSAPQHRPRPVCDRQPLERWNHEVPGRRIVNTVNDALLAQRSWTSAPADSHELLKALAGAMHPVAEAHAVGADSAFARLWQAVRPTTRTSGVQ